MTGSNRRERRAAAVQARKVSAPRPQRPPDLQQALDLEQGGRLREAFDAYLQLVSSRPGDLLARSHFGHFLAANTPQRAHPDIDAVLRAALDQGWIRPDLLAQPVARYLDAKWPGAMPWPLPSE